VEDYIMTTHSDLERPKIYLKRILRELFVNPCNKKILSLHPASMDIQFVLDAYACATYFIDYINKSNRGMSKMLTDIVSEIHHGDNTIRDHFRTVANAFINSSEISAQEAAWSLLRLPLSYVSDVDVYILISSPPDERTQFIKDDKKLRNLDPESK
jgi:hypothetical protein